METLVSRATLTHTLVSKRSCPNGWRQCRPRIKPFLVMARQSHRVSCPIPSLHNLRLMKQFVWIQPARMIPPIRQPVLIITSTHGRAKHLESQSRTTLTTIVSHIWWCQIGAPHQHQLVSPTPGLLRMVLPHIVWIWQRSGIRGCSLSWSNITQAQRLFPLSILLGIKTHTGMSLYLSKLVETPTMVHQIATTILVRRGRRVGVGVGELWVLQAPVTIPTIVSHSTRPVGPVLISTGLCHYLKEHWSYGSLSYDFVFQTKMRWAVRLTKPSASSSTTLSFEQGGNSISVSGVNTFTYSQSINNESKYVQMNLSLRSKLKIKRA